MLLTFLRSTASVLSGLLVAFALLAATEQFSNVFHPYPPGANTSDFEVCKAQVASYPTWVLACCAAGWAAMPLAGSWLATLLGRHPAHGIIVGGILLALAGFNMYMLPYPLWFPAVILVAFPLVTLLGAWLGRGTTPLPKQL